MTPVAIQAEPLPVLPYKSPEVPTLPPRTWLRMFFAGIKCVVAKIFLCIRLVILALGHAVLAASVVLRLAFSLIAIILLFVGGLRWETIKSRTLRAADWVDVKTLQAVRLLRRTVVWSQ